MRIYKATTGGTICEDGDTIQHVIQGRTIATATTAEPEAYNHIRAQCDEIINTFNGDPNLSRFSIENYQKVESGYSKDFLAHAGVVF